MSKSPVKIYKGIEYVRLSELPTAQARSLESWAVGREVLIKILIDKEIQEDCIQYRHYSEWFELHQNNLSGVASPQTIPAQSNNSSLVLKT